MSENSNKNKVKIGDLLKKSGLTFFLVSFLCLCLSLVFAFILNMTSAPEDFYQLAGYAILIIASFIVGRLYLRKQSGGIFYIIIASSVLLSLVFALVSVAINNGKTTILPIIIRLFIIATVMLLSIFLGRQKKRKTKTHKRR